MGIKNRIIIIIMMIIPSFVNAQTHSINRGSNTSESNKRALQSKVESMKAVDLGVSVKWASCNLAAKTPSDEGGYYAWAETKTKKNYNPSTSPFFNEQTGECNYPKANIAGSKYDAAYVKLGGNWRMPTKKEFQELIDKCEWTWSLQNGMKGYTVKGENGNSIFFPAAGRNDCGDIRDWKSVGSYRCSDDTNSGIYSFEFTSESYELYEDSYEWMGYSIRPVSN